MPSETEEEDIKHLLHSVLIPTFPPNRSQWKKLEIALKFINASKKEVKKRNQEQNVNIALKFKFKTKESSTLARANDFCKEDNYKPSHKELPCSRFFQNVEKVTLFRFVDSVQNIM